MKDKGKKIENIVLIVIGINMLFLMFFLLYFMFNISKEITAGLIAFVGAIIGGAITLLGVRLTIENKDKQKAKEELPKKLLNLEKAINKIDKVVKKLETERKITVLSVDINTELYTNEKYKEYTDSILDSIRDYLILVDSETYKVFLDTREKMNLLEFELAKIQIDLFDFHEKHDDPEKVNEDYVSDFLADKSKIENEVRKQNNILVHKITMNYWDIFIQLQSKHESLIKELDY